MTMGTVSTHSLTDIANAIRYQAGVSRTYKPREMAAAVAALDGTDAGGYVERGYPDIDEGIVSDSALSGIADAIRAQNGSSATYKPRQMAAAILALTWDTGLKPRAVLSSEGVLEFNYLSRRRMVSGGTPVDAWEVSTSGYASSGARPWDSIKTQVTRVVIDSSFASVGIADCSYWFLGFTALVEVTGFENLSGITTATQMFASCAALESIYATSYTNSISSGSNIFYGCPRLVGGTDCFVPSNTAAASTCKLGTGGVLTNPAADPREWCYVHLLSNGAVHFSSDPEPADPDSCVSSGHLCANARYKTSGILPGYEHRADITTVVFLSGMSGYSRLNMDYWFYGLANLTSVSGFWNLENVATMRYTFASCTSLVELDMCGLDPSGLTNIANIFSGCTNLQTITVDSTWVLPSGVSGANAFYGCASLVGGNGTTYSSTKIAGTYMRIDTVSTPGYLTGW